MSAVQNETGVAFIVREKFSWALASLRRLYSVSGAPFTLYFVDSVYPDAVRAEIDVFLADKPDVIRIRPGRFIYPNEGLNCVVDQLREPYLWVVQNDVLVSRDSLKYMLETARVLGCDLVAPVTLDMETGKLDIHRHTDEPAGIIDEDGKVYHRRPASPEVREGRPRVYQFEMHSFLATAEALRMVYPLPPLNSREHIDLAVSLWRAGKTAYFDERARTAYMGSPPLRLRDFDCDHFRFRWDPVRARQSHEYVEKKWHLADMESAMGFVQRQLQALRPEAVLRHYDSISESDSWSEDLMHR